MRVYIAAALIAATALTLSSAPTAFADSNDSSNWAGYAIHRSGVQFTKVVGTWRQPRATCARGNRTYSATWIGLGGYSLTSNALEQIGTEVDCSPAGRPVLSAWYEVVPAPSIAIGRFSVHPGDSIAAVVSVAGHQVELALYDRTTHRMFQRKLYAGSIDVSSAEWIEEAPSECVSPNSCQTLPLADFGSVRFATAFATATTGQAGPIASSHWGHTRIRLVPGGRRFVDYQGYGVPAGAATPSGLFGRGAAFKVTYAEVALAGNAFDAARAASVSAGYLVHPPRR